MRKIVIVILIVGLIISPYSFASPPPSLPQLPIIQHATYFAKNYSSTAFGRYLYRSLLWQAKILKIEDIPTVMDKPKLAPSGDKHDYLSYSIYYHSENPNKRGKYIDGVVNTDSFKLDDRLAFEKVINAITSLGFTHVATGSSDAGRKAAELLQKWFIDPSTAMNPNLQYAGLKPGHTSPDYWGFQEGKNLPYVLALSRNLKHPDWTAKKQQKLETWFDRYLEWASSSVSATFSSTSTNNHKTWFVAQYANLLMLKGNKIAARAIVRDFWSNSFPLQMDESGKQIQEIQRTRSLTYSISNIYALFEIYRLAVILNAWPIKDGQANIKKRLENAYLFMRPAMRMTTNWDYSEISDVSAMATVPIILGAAVLLEHPEWILDIRPANMADKVCRSPWWVRSGAIQILNRQSINECSTLYKADEDSVLDLLTKPTDKKKHP